ncbi:uncharacterized protein LOC108623303 [Ceratina calcarata]|uniref:Protein DP71L n=1 Tax=Ceratina calcarata TaxID=156304 RepID=A0AAJ7N516_9HYME|nr:uncharacterized protein LOC108623303 [Ceratina calcarata]
MRPTQSLFGETTMEKMCSLDGTLSRKGTMPGPKKESMFHGVFNALNVVWEQFTKVPSFIARINHPLSVTIVNNDGHIPQDILTNLTTKLEPLGNENMFIHIKESLNIVESIHNNMFNEKQPCLSRNLNKGMKSGLNLSSEYINNYEAAEGSDDKMESIEKNIIKSDHIYLLPNENVLKTYEEESFELVCPELRVEENPSIESTEEYCNSKSTCNELFPNSSADNKTLQTVSTSDSNMQTIEQASVSNMITNMIQKVFGGDRTCRTDSMESDTISKRSNGSPKQRRRLNAVAKGRGRGRGKSQLRRSGVSQTRHRKERTKHDIAADIETELRCWQDFDIYDTMETTESEDCFNFNENAADTLQYVVEESVSSVAYIFSLDDVKPKIQKSKTRKNCEQATKYSGNMESIPECTERTNYCDFDFIENKNNLCKNAFRSRLMSESSIDSEDSYCIVFETGSEVTYDSDLEDSVESDTESSDDEETCKDRGCVSPVAKVKFDLNPVVHVMVQWDYAYRAARKGPWEEMARDRERFRGRINCIERVLNPILTSQHRNHIWQERFAANE